MGSASRSHCGDIRGEGQTHPHASFPVSPTPRFSSYPVPRPRSVLPFPAWLRFTEPSACYGSVDDRVGLRALSRNPLVYPYIPGSGLLQDLMSPRRGAFLFPLSLFASKEKGAAGGAREAPHVTIGTAPERTVIQKLPACLPPHLRLSPSPVSCRSCCCTLTLDPSRRIFLYAARTIRSPRGGAGGVQFRQAGQPA